MTRSKQAYTRRSLLRNERLCVAPKHAKIFRKKSRDRQADITTDVSMEVFLPSRGRPTLVWIFECKNYSGRLPVDDVEEFHANLQQIGEDNTRGTDSRQRSAGRRAAEREDHGVQ